MDEIIELFKTYTAALPTSVVAIILILIGLKILLEHLGILRF